MIGAITAASPRPRATLVMLAPGTTLVWFDETGYNEANEPIVKAYSYFRDDLLRLRLLRRRV